MATIAGFTGDGEPGRGHGARRPAVADSNTVPGSLCRLPNGNDTNDASTDWKFSEHAHAGRAQRAVT